VKSLSTVKNMSDTSSGDVADLKKLLGMMSEELVGYRHELQSGGNDQSDYAKRIEVFTKIQLSENAEFAALKEQKKELEIVKFALLSNVQLNQAKAASLATELAQLRKSKVERSRQCDQSRASVDSAKNDRSGELATIAAIRELIDTQLSRMPEHVRGRIRRLSVDAPTHVEIPLAPLEGAPTSISHDTEPSVESTGGEYMGMGEYMGLESESQGTQQSASGSHGSESSGSHESSGASGTHETEATGESSSTATSTDVPISDVPLVSPDGDNNDLTQLPEADGFVNPPEVAPTDTTFSDAPPIVTDTPPSATPPPIFNEGQLQAQEPGDESRFRQVEDAPLPLYEPQKLSLASSPY